MPKVRERGAPAAAPDIEPAEPHRPIPPKQEGGAHALDLFTPPKSRSLLDELARNQTALEGWKREGNEEMAAFQEEEISALLGRIRQSADQENRPPEARDAAGPQVNLRLAERMTADEAADRIQEFNTLFGNADYEFRELRGQNFTRASDQSAVEKKVRGKGIGPYYVNDKGDKMLAADRDAHGGGTFKYFKKIGNQWVRQHTLDHVGRPLRG